MEAIEKNPFSNLNRFSNLTITKRKELIECHPERSSYLTIRRMKRQGKLFPPPLSFAFVIEKCPENGANIQSNKKEGWHVISRKSVMGLFSSSLEMPPLETGYIIFHEWKRQWKLFSWILTFAFEIGKIKRHVLKRLQINTPI